MLYPYNYAPQPVVQPWQQQQPAASNMDLAQAMVNSLNTVSQSLEKVVSKEKRTNSEKNNDIMHFLKESEKEIADHIHIYMNKHCVQV